MNTNDQDRLIPLELTRTDLNYLRNFLYEESLAAEIDHENVETLHNDMAIRAAVQVLSREIETMTKIIDEICRVIDAIDAHESRARKIAAMTPPVA